MIIYYFHDPEIEDEMAIIAAFGDVEPIGTNGTPLRLEHLTALFRERS